jgi:hypothetical protein
VKSVTKGTGNEALSSSLGAVSSIILAHGVFNYSDYMAPKDNISK